MSVHLKQCLQPCLCRSLDVPIPGLRRGIAKNEVFAKIAPALFNHPLCLWFPAFIVRAGHIERTITATTEIGHAKGTSLLPAYRDLKL